MVGKQIGQTFNETVIQPVVNEMKNVAQASMEQIAGSASTPQDPALAQQKMADEQKRRNWALRVIDWYKKIQEDQMRVRNAKMHQEQVQTQDQQQKTQVKQFKLMEEKKKKQQFSDLEQKARGRETRGGVGG